MDLNHNIIWLTGNSGAGKTTLANLLAPKLGAIILDNDEIRQSLAKHIGYSKEERHEHNLRVATFAGFLAARTPVIVSVIAPFEATRQKIHELIAPVWVYVKREQPERAESPYEPPQLRHITVSSDTHTAEQNAQIIFEFLK